MRTKTLQAVAVTLGLGVCTVAQAQTSYVAPSKWNNFRTVSDEIETIPPAPTPQLAPAAVPESIPAPPLPTPINPAMIDTGAAVGTGCAPCQSDSSVSPFQQALSSPWAESTMGQGLVAGRPALNPWFGSANLLFLTMENGRGRSVISGDILGGFIRSSRVDPEATVGFDVGVGRYFNCGQFGFGLNYFFWDPSEEVFTENRDLAGDPIVAGGGLRADNLFYNDVDINIDFGGGAVGEESVYDVINGSGAYDGARAMRLRRDLSLQGIEANLFMFGLMGARRAAYAGCPSEGCLGLGAGTGFGGAAGPLVRASGGRLRVMNSHGFRWFQVRDSAELAFNIDGGAGYQDQDLYDNVDVENNLFGYQFGSMLNYCLTSRLNAHIGAKFGIYGNHVDYRHRLGTRTTAATVGGEDVDVQSSDVSLAGLGELDLGLGYRLNNAWSVRGGYRLIAIAGIADSIENMQDTAYNDISLVDDFDADDSLILHGGYVGLTFNW